MKGAPPEIFNGDRSQTANFMLQFQIWWMVNNRAEAMINPFQRIALCLSFIRGKRVDKWVEEKINQLQRAVVGDPTATPPIPPTHLDTDEGLWNAFGADFRLAFQDTAAEENAYAALKVLTMKDDQIDEYIAHFEVLLAKAGWQCHEKGSMDMFFNGLTKNVQRRILSVYSILPTTLDEWQSAARQIVQRHRLIDVKIGPYRPNFQKQLTRAGRNPKGQFKKARSEDAMDVDAVEIDVSAAKPAMRCFYCNNEGHMKKNCRKYQAAQERERGLEKEKPPQKTKA